jgi:hypothetical protein
MITKDAAEVFIFVGLNKVYYYNVTNEYNIEVLVLDVQEEADLKASRRNNTK